MKLTMSSIKEQSKLVRRLSLLLVILAVLGLSACGGAKKVSSKDNSADYKSARALAPLKKPTRADKAAPQTPNIVARTVNPKAITAPSATVTPLATSDQNAVINGRVVEVKSGQARLEITADFDQAWMYLSANLKVSDITIFTRNKEAGRFSIGCSSIDAAPTVVKSGRWSFLNRDKQKSLEYCGLQAVAKRGVTTVSVLNREDKEVSAEYSKQIFERILNN